MTFKPYLRNQIFLLPPSSRDFLGDGHEAVILDEFLQELDTNDLERSYRNEQGGSSAYHPGMLLAVLIYGYMNGIFSSRTIAKRLSQDLAFMYLAGNTKPDFRILARFRKEKGEYLETIMAQVVLKARELGLVSFGTCSLDGTKIRANASKDKNYSTDGLEKNIRALVKEAERIDAEGKRCQVPFSQTILVLTSLPASAKASSYAKGYGGRVGGQESSGGQTGCPVLRQAQYQKSGLGGPIFCADVGKRKPWYNDCE